MILLGFGLFGLICYQGWIVYRTWTYRSYWSWLYPGTDYLGFRVRRSEQPKKYYTYLTLHVVFLMVFVLMLIL